MLITSINFILLFLFLCFRKRHETNIKDLEKQQDSYREKLSKLQQELQKAQMGAKS